MRDGLYQIEPTQLINTCAEVQRVVELLRDVTELVVMFVLELPLVVGHHHAAAGLLIHFGIKMAENSRRQEIEDRGATWSELQAPVADLRYGQHKSFVRQLVVLILIMGMEVNCNAEADLIDPFAEETPGLIISLVREPRRPMILELAGVDVIFLDLGHDFLFYLPFEISRSLDTRGQCKFERNWYCDDNVTG